MRGGTLCFIMGHQERCLTEDSNLLELQVHLKEKDWIENATVKLSCCEMGQVSPKFSHHGVHRGPTAVGAESITHSTGCAGMQKCMNYRVTKAHRDPESH